MVNIILRIVPFWSGFHLIEAALRPPRAFARGAALPVPAAIQSAGFFMTCGRGGTGRRAALRSLWPKGRGSSSLLDRTIENPSQSGGLAEFSIGASWLAGAPLKSTETTPSRPLDRPRRDAPVGRAGWCRDGRLICPG